VAITPKFRIAKIAFDNLFLKIYVQTIANFFWEFELVNLREVGLSKRGDRWNGTQI
jgi:hypothetical protein